MSQALKVKIAGLYTFQNDLSAVPEGALSQADNIVIDRDSEAEPRRGFDYLSHNSGVQSVYSDTTYRASKLFFYQNKTLSYYGPVGAPTTLAHHDSSSGWTNYSGTFSPPSSTVTMRSTQASQNFYYTTSNGVYKLDAYNGTPAVIGVPPALDVTASIAATVTPTASTATSSRLLQSVSSITGVAVGMSITGTNIPANSYITSFNATTITISAAATGSGSTITMTISAPATWLATGASSGLNTTAYRILWGIKDANKNLILGAPSQISQVSNTTAAVAAPIVNFSINPTITTAHFYQIYRPAAVANGITPNDEGQLVYEGNPTAADITYGQISVVDIVPDALRGATIYTAQSQDGLANENAPPPLAKDIAVFRDCLFYANTSTLQSFNLTLLGTGTPTGIQATDTLTIGGVVFTAAASETASTGTFAVASTYLLTAGSAHTHTNTTIDTIAATTTGMAVGMAITGTGIPAGAFITAVVNSSTVTISIATTGTATIADLTVTGDSASQAIRDTALSLVRVINRYASSTVYAYYLSGPTDLPGMILLQARTVGAAVFTVISTRTSCWSPVITTAQSSTNDVNKNAVFYSKPSQPEAVPLGFKIPVGSADKNILRIIPLRDSLFVLKEDGIFRIYGTSSENFQVTPLDNTANLIAADSAVALNNQIWALTTQGVVSISETGVQIMSRSIESDLTSLTSLTDGSGNSAYSTLQQTSFGIAYESSRAYYLFVITGGTDTGPTQYYRYNTITNTWTHGALAKACGGVNPNDDKLYLGSSAAAIIDVERKSLTYSDYADYSSTQTFSGIFSLVTTGTTHTSTLIDSLASTTGVTVGMGVSGSGLPAGAKVSVINSATSITLDNATGSSLGGTAITFSAIPATVFSITSSDTIEVGSIIFQSSTVFGTVASVDAIVGTVTMTLPTAFSNAAADVLAPIPCAMTWIPLTLENPGMSKQVHETSLLFKSDFNGSATVGFSSDVSPAVETETISGGNVGGWGLFGWGGPFETPLGVPWGGANRRRPIRVMVPRNHQRASVLNISFSHSYGYSPWILQGLSGIGDATSERVDT